MEWLITRTPATSPIEEVKLTLSAAEFIALVVVLQGIGGNRPSLRILTSKSSDWESDIKSNPADHQRFVDIKSKLSGQLWLEG